MEKEPNPNKEIEVKENSFLLTWDIENLIGQLCKAYGWRLPESAVFQNIKRELTDALENCFPGSVVTFASEEISRGLVHPRQQHSPIDALTTDNLG